MFVRYFNEVAVPYRAAARVLQSHPENWLPSVRIDGGRLTTRLRLQIGGLKIGKRVEVEVGAAQVGDVKTVVPISWKATGPKGLFPMLEGQLVVSPNLDGTTLLSLMLDYTPPMGALGAAADQLLLHRVAWATLDDFRTRLGAAIRSTRAPARAGPVARASA